MSNQDQVDQYRRQMNQKKQELDAVQSERSQYMATAQRIGEIYDRLAQNKATVREKRDALNSFKDDEYAWFVGSQYDEAYRGSVQTVVGSYDTLIKLLDTNLDMLTNERRRYENKAYECDGLIGVLERGINYLGRSIQNLIN